ncbi:MAG: alanine racemase [Candidatus Hydrogenedentes bacterium]|nr:alanine racemase [Candidatus Hydrogenedentota bacterium]MBI3119304.1 alanine racemase [Candidatus Hydrogenedentota bacterium]
MSTSPSRAIVDLQAYRHNIEVVRRYIGENTGIIAVVKANGYGHGLLQIAEQAVRAKVGMLGVATVEEGIRLREAGIEAPVLVLFQPDPDALAAIIEHRLTLMLADVATAELLGEMAHRVNRVVRVHCQVDSGMGRQGFALETAAQDIQYLTRISHIDIEGIATHFPTAEKPEDQFTYNQIKSFKQLLKQLDKQGIPYEMSHAANSAAVVNYHGSAFDLVRPGLMTYGVWPSTAVPLQNPLQPVVRWETRVTQVRHLEPGSSVGYGRTYTTAARMRAAILPVGYADGYKHSLSNKADVLIRGKRCPVRGSVCMDQIVVDVSEIHDVHAGDVATLIGSDGAESITPEELARHANTIPYEILTGIGTRVPREYINAN